MEIVIFCGIQATGKSFFYKKYFFNTHVRISMDLLKTRHREKLFVDLCFFTEKSFVVDNTNPQKKDRANYIERAKERKAKVIGYYFQSNIEESFARNGVRDKKEFVPILGIKATHKKLEIPTFNEGFDELYYVQIVDDEFIIKDWEL